MFSPVEVEGDKSFPVLLVSIWVQQQAPFGRAGIRRKCEVKEIMEWDGKSGKGMDIVYLMRTILKLV